VTLVFIWGVGGVGVGPFILFMYYVMCLVFFLCGFAFINYSFVYVYNYLFSYLFNCLYIYL
jgi:hypothetical protein